MIRFFKKFFKPVNSKVQQQNVSRDLIVSVASYAHFNPKFFTGTSPVECLQMVKVFFHMILFTFIDSELNNNNYFSYYEKELGLLFWTGNDGVFEASEDILMLLCQ